MGGHWLFLTVVGFILAGVVGFCLWWAYGRLLMLLAQYRYRYTRIPTIVSPSGSPLSPNRGALRIMPAFLRRMSSSKKVDEETGVSEAYYELNRRRD